MPIITQTIDYNVMRTQIRPSLNGHSGQYVRGMKTARIALRQLDEDRDDCVAQDMLVSAVTKLYKLGPNMDYTPTEAAVVDCLVGENYPGLYQRIQNNVGYVQ